MTPWRKLVRWWRWRRLMAYECPACAAMRVVYGIDCEGPEMGSVLARLGSPCPKAALLHGNGPKVEKLRREWGL